ncbi:MAG: ATP-binding protein [Bacteroidetes bacterium]|nr:MAG: ATP-binding protein [Bacteroidota bacterium]
MSIKPWYKIVTPREDLREGKPLDASEFAVHLDHVRDGHAVKDYQNPERFFERTFLSKNLTQLACETIRRLSGITTETSSVFNMSTQFGGGKTHALTLLYHLAKNGSASHSWMGVNKLLSSAGVKSIPEASTAVFVGTEFDSLRGRGGDDGIPLRKTPWGEIAFQLRGEEGFKIMKAHDGKGIAPAGDVIRELFKEGSPCLILMDEVMNYISRNRKSGLSTQLYDFIQSLSETVRGKKNVSLVISIPKSDTEMSTEDFNDFNILKKMLDRVGKAFIISSDSETIEIIRRRLFEWDSKEISVDGKVSLCKEAIATCNEYSDWILEYRNQIPNWFPIDNSREAFYSCYPFHPALISVFERKWQSLPRFQQTRGILRLLALWVSHAFINGFKGSHSDGLIGLGTAPLEDALFRQAVFEQLGESKLEVAVLSDITGKNDSFAGRLDKESTDSIKKARLHQKVSTSIFFESSGGQLNKVATLPEIRLAVSEPILDIGNVETVLDELSRNCYYLNIEKNSYRFGLTPNLNKLLSDRQASMKDEDIDELIKEEIAKVFVAKPGIERILFPELSNQIPDRPQLTLIVMAIDKHLNSKATTNFIESCTKDYGRSGRTYKSALIWIIPDSSNSLIEDARKVLAWEDIKVNEISKLSEDQQRELSENFKKSKRDLIETIWRTYKNVGMLGRDNSIIYKDLGLIHSSSSDSMPSFIINRLKEDEEITDAVNPNFLIRNWPPAIKEWSTKSLKDIFFASPIFPRLLNAERLKETISRGVSGGVFAYIGKTSDIHYEPLYFETDLNANEIEFSDEMFIIQADEARKHIEPPILTYLEIVPSYVTITKGQKFSFSAKGKDQYGQQCEIPKVTWNATGGIIENNGLFTSGKDEGEFLVFAEANGIKSDARVTILEQKKPGSETKQPLGKNVINWEGEIPYLKWMNFYQKIIAKYAGTSIIKIGVSLEIENKSKFSEQTIDDIKAALKELGLNDDINF